MELAGLRDTLYYKINVLQDNFDPPVGDGRKPGEL